MKKILLTTALLASFCLESRASNTELELSNKALTLGLPGGPGVTQKMIEDRELELHKHIAHRN